MLVESDSHIRQLEQRASGGSFLVLYEVLHNELHKPALEKCHLAIKILATAFSESLVSQRVLALMAQCLDHGHTGLIVSKLGNNLLRNGFTPVCSQ